MTEISIAEELTMLQDVVDTAKEQMAEFWPLLTLATEEKSRQRMKGMIARLVSMMDTLERIEHKLENIKLQMEPQMIIPDDEYQQMLDMLGQLDALREECSQLTAYYDYLETSADLNGTTVFH